MACLAYSLRRHEKRPARRILSRHHDMSMLVECILGRLEFHSIRQGQPGQELRFVDSRKVLLALKANLDQSNCRQSMAAKRKEMRCHSDDYTLRRPQASADLRVNASSLVLQYTIRGTHRHHRGYSYEPWIPARHNMTILQWIAGSIICRKLKIFKHSNRLRSDQRGGATAL
jgi:hypothetical protein